MISFHRSLAKQYGPHFTFHFRLFRFYFEANFGREAKSDLPIE